MQIIEGIAVVHFYSIFNLSGIRMSQTLAGGRGQKGQA